jgi:hypothetical protein
VFDQLAQATSGYLCVTTGVSDTSLQRMPSGNTDNVVYACPVCPTGAGGTQLSEHIEHVIDTHMHVCSCCGQAFTTRAARHAHYLTKVCRQACVFIACACCS